MESHFIRCFRVKVKIKMELIYQIERISRDLDKFTKDFSISIYFTVVIIVSIKHKQC